MPSLIDVLSTYAHIGKYKLVRRLGSGSFGEVWLARDSWLDIDVALKFLYDQNLDFNLLCAEARKVASLDCEYIVSIKGVEKIDNIVFFVFEYMTGGSLSNRLFFAAPEFPKEIVPIFRNIGLALAFSHDKGVIHRDVKPLNILLDEHSFAKLADFGIATNSTDLGCFAGTLPYCAPESLHGVSDHLTDMFSLGVSLYETIAGRLPFHSLDEASHYAAVIQSNVIPVSEAPMRSVPRYFADLVHACISPDRASRPGNMREFVRILSTGSDMPYSLSSSSSWPKTYLVPSSKSLLACDAEGICYSANNRLFYGNKGSRSVSTVLLSACGPSLKKETDVLVENNGPVPLGSAVMSDSHELRNHGCKSIFHLVTLFYNPATKSYELKNDSYLHDISMAVKNACEMASEARLSSLAIPLIGTRIGLVSIDQSAAAIVRGLYWFRMARHDSNNSLEDIRLSSFDSEPVFRAFARQVKLVSFRDDDIFRSKSHALVVSANNWLYPGSGGAKKACQLGGSSLCENLSKLRSGSANYSIGSAIEGCPGDLEDKSSGYCARLFYSIAMGYQCLENGKPVKRILASPASVYNAVVATLRLANAHGVKSIAFPLMCARPGYSTVPESSAALIMAESMLCAVNDIRDELTMERIHIHVPPSVLTKVNEMLYSFRDI